jgi:hypothetical protein
MVQRKIFISRTTQIGYIILAENEDVPTTEKLHFEQPDCLEFDVCLVYHTTPTNQKSEGVVDGEEEARRAKGRDIA